MRRLALAALLGLGAFPSAARAYDPATTHAGITEKAALASSLHKVLSRRLGRPLGLLEPLQLHSRLLEPAARQTLWLRLAALDPAGGYRPANDGSASALSWVVAGAVLAETPPERGRNHFLDPTTRKGLRDDPGLSGLAHTVRLAVDNAATVRQIAAGTAFDLTGAASVDWVQSPQNDQGVPALLDHLERAVAGAQPAERDSALVRALLALGGVVAVLQDAGEPAHVRNDFRAAFLRRQGPSGWARASAYERFVADRWGRLGVPDPIKPPRRPTLDAFFTAGDGEGLADRTHRRFFSAGTIPEDVPVVARSTPREVLAAARASLAFPAPALPALELRAATRRRYVVVEGRRVLAYEREPRRVRFLLDEAVYLDTARVLLPEIGGYATGLIDHLFRASASLQASGREVTISFEGLAGAVKAGRAVVVAEDAAGARTLVQGVAGLAGGAGATITAPAGARRIAVVLRGRDDGGPFVATGEIPLE